MSLKKILALGITVIVTLLLVEVALRIQQNLGPIYDLKFDEYTLDCLSDVVNHKPPLRKICVLSGKSIYGKYNGYKYISYFDEDGIRKNSLRYNQRHDGKRISILFMGDSFMEGYDDNNTVPQHVWVYFRKKGFLTTIHNAGCASYSPAIYIPQSKQLIPKINPDFVVVDIDETDLGDDFIRYRKLIVRDNTGRIIAVNSTPVQYEHLSGFIKINKQIFYTVRLFKTIYHTKIYMPNYEKHYREDNRHPLSFSWDKRNNVRTIYQKEIDFFRNNVSELAETLIELMGDRQRILFLYHPYLKHLQFDSNGRYWNDFVTNTIREVVETYKLPFYDATDDLRKSFGGQPQDFYWNQNIHFNFKGLKIYGEFVAKRLLALIDKRN